MKTSKITAASLHRTVEQQGDLTHFSCLIIDGPKI